MEVLFRFSTARTFDQFKKINELFYFCWHNQKSASFFTRSLNLPIDSNTGITEREFNLAVMHLQMIEKWREIDRYKHVFRFIEYDAVIDRSSSSLERALNKITLPVDSPFWDIYFPPNFRTDQSTIRFKTDAIVSNIPGDLPRPAPGFARNFGKPFLITDKHPSFVVYNLLENIAVLQRFYAFSIA